jgi:WD40 repeat protein
MQRVYTHHQRAITCFCLNKDSKTIASSEGEQNCKIHIWKYDSLTTLHIIKIDHQHQISHMTFSHNYECLLTVADR